ncbi:MAG: septal ring lytic transglycosylase RlpA family lipoprotein [Enterovirga sp.]|nr:septal ring lytic transglycosylase RlpA family lipoprotein [Enterovirga sp.]
MVTKAWIGGAVSLALAASATVTAVAVARAPDTLSRVPAARPAVDIPLPDAPGPLAAIEPAPVVTAGPEAAAEYGPALFAAPVAAPAASFTLRPGLMGLQFGFEGEPDGKVGDRVPDGIRQAALARDTTLSHVSVLPPPRPAFREATLMTGPARPGLIEVRPPEAPSGWSEVALTLPDWAGAVALPQRPGKPERALQQGLASWYGPGFHGRKTASGERFDQNALTAAHRSLPFGTKVKVVDQKSGRAIVVRINDRGPFKHGRVIDLSKASAEALGMGGLARVQIVSAE